MASSGPRTPVAFAQRKLQDPTHTARVRAFAAAAPHVVGSRSPAVPISIAGLEGGEERGLFHVGRALALRSSHTEGLDLGFTGANTPSVRTERAPRSDAGCGPCSVAADDVSSKHIVVGAVRTRACIL